MSEVFEAFDTTLKVSRRCHFHVTVNLMLSSNYLPLKHRVTAQKPRISKLRLTATSRETRHVLMELPRTAPPSLHKSISHTVTTPPYAWVSSKGTKPSAAVVDKLRWYSTTPAIGTCAK
jgi:hypothetical protein